MIIHPTAVLDSGADVADGVHVGPFAVVEAGARLDEGVVLGAHCVVHGSVTLRAGVRVAAHAVLGGDPQHRGFDVRVPTRLEIGARSVVHEHSSVHRSTDPERPTRIGADCLVMGAVHVAHDCVVEDGAVVTHGAALGGHVVLGAGAVVGGLSAVHQHTRVGRLAMVGGGAMVARDVLPFSTVIGAPARHTGVNTTGLARAGLAPDAVERVRRWCARQAEGTAAPRGDDGPLVAELEAFLAASRRGLCRWATPDTEPAA